MLYTVCFFSLLFGLEEKFCLTLTRFLKRPVCLFLASHQERRRGDDCPVAILASLYVHVMIRRFVPSLATEMHLTIRLLHVHSEVERSNDRVLMSEQECQEDPSSSRHIAGSPTAASEIRLKERKESQGGMNDKPEKKIVFNTGLDCRSFAASVLLGLKSLLPHIGKDTLDLLAESLALASQVKISATYFTTACC